MCCEDLRSLGLDVLLLIMSSIRIRNYFEVHFLVITALAVADALSGLSKLD